MNAIAKSETGALALPEDELLTVLQSSLYPGAAPASIRMVLGYCRAAGLDPLQKPVHIVPMWDSKAKAMRDVVMPGINLYRTQATRSGQLAGMTEPEFGEDITETIGGQKITFPLWCRVTVKRALANGQIAEFTAREFWMENYAAKGGSEKSIAPNAMWTKRPRGQLAKCAQAQALRMAFPEIAGAATAEELEGKTLPAHDDATPQREEWLARIKAAKTEDDLKTVSKAVVAELNAARDREFYGALVAAVQARGGELKKPPPAASDVIDVEPVLPVDPFVAAMEKAESEASHA